MSAEDQDNYMKRKAEDDAHYKATSAIKAQEKQESVVFVATYHGPVKDSPKPGEFKYLIQEQEEEKEEDDESEEESSDDETSSKILTEKQKKIKKIIDAKIDQYEAEENRPNFIRRWTSAVINLFRRKNRPHVVG